MRHISEFINEARVEPVEFDRKKYGDYHYDDNDFERIQPYAEDVYNEYVKNFGDVAPKSIRSKGNRMSKFEWNVTSLIDTGKLSVHNAAFIKYYIYNRLNGDDPDTAVEAAIGTYKSIF